MRVSVSLLLLLSACSADRITLTFPDSDAPSYVFSVKDSIRRLVVAVDAADPNPIGVAVTSRQDVVEAIAYDKTLAELELVSGVLQQVNDGPSLGGTPEVVRGFYVADLDAEEWNLVEQVSLELQNFRVPRRSKCSKIERLDGDQFRFPSPEGFNSFIGLQLDANTAMFGDEDVLFLAHSDRTVEELTVRAPPGARFLTAIEDPRGQMWMAGNALYTAELDGTTLVLDEVEGSTHGADLRRISVDYDSSGERRINAVDSTGQLLQLEAGGWRSLHESLGSRGWVGLIRLGLDEFFFSHEDSADVGWYRDGVVTFIQGSTSQVLTLVQIDSGIYAASALGELRVFDREEGKFVRKTEDPGFDLGIRSLADFHGTLLVGGANGRLVEIIPWEETCRDRAQQVRMNFVNSIAVFENDIVATAGNDDGGGTNSIDFVAVVPTL